MIGTKRTVVLGGRNVPGIQSTEATTERVTLPNGRTILAQFAEIITLRTTNPVGPDGEPQEVTEYITSTFENLRFAPLRFTTVVGLDADEDGAILTIRDLEERRAKDIAARQLQRAQAQAPTVMDIEDAIALDAPEQASA